jgi:hypothetical protein
MAEAACPAILGEAPMWRVVWRPVLLFFLPFLTYAVLLVLRRTTPFARRNWSQGTVSTLTLTGLFIAVVGVFLFGIFAQRHLGAYVPAHLENGKLVPGYMQ